MKTIWKYPFEISSHVELSMPRGAKFLHVEVQRDVPCLWALVDPGNKPSNRVLTVIGTGHTTDTFTTKRHVGTILQGDFVWHVFEITPPLGLADL